MWPTAEAIEHAVAAAGAVRVDNRVVRKASSASRVVGREAGRYRRDASGCERSRSVCRACDKARRSPNHRAEQGSNPTGNARMVRTTTSTSDDTFAERIAANRGIVVKVAGTYARHPDERDDLAQDIVAQLWRAWPRYDASRPFATWMYRIALNVAIGHSRTEARRRSHAATVDTEADDVVDEGADPEHARRVRELRKFIDRQSPLDRALLLLYIDGCLQRDIAEILGLSETNVATKIGRLKLRIRSEI